MKGPNARLPLRLVDRLCGDHLQPSFCFLLRPLPFSFLLSITNRLQLLLAYPLSLQPSRRAQVRPSSPPVPQAFLRKTPISLVPSCHLPLPRALQGCSRPPSWLSPASVSPTQHPTTSDGSTTTSTPTLVSSSSLTLCCCLFRSLPPPPSFWSAADRSERAGRAQTAITFGSLGLWSSLGGEELLEGRKEGQGEEECELMRGREGRHWPKRGQGGRSRGCVAGAQACRRPPRPGREDMSSRCLSRTISTSVLVACLVVGVGREGGRVAGLRAALESGGDRDDRAKGLERPRVGRRSSLRLSGKLVVLCILSFVLETVLSLV